MVRILVIVATLMALSSCGGGDSPGSGGPAATSRVEVTVLVDLDATLPDDVGGVDLGELAPDDDLTFCEAFSAAPTRWVDDAVVPLQFWIDAWAGVDDQPAVAVEALDALQEFADRKLAWNFKRIEERPVYDETVARHAVTLADAAVDRCPDLPLVVGFNSEGAPPAWWEDEPDFMKDGHCTDDIVELEDAIDAYVDLTGRQPGHNEQLEAELFVAWAFGDGDLFVSSEFVGVERDTDGVARAVPVPGGACDR